MENFNLTFPISTIKKENRIVVGIATADNIDKSGDIVDFQASIEAFESWEGNIREMHAPIAVGKAINYEPVKITGEDGAEYNAMKVEAYISKGAQDTWEKILDGTLRAFSIGGKIIEKEVDAKKMFRGRPASVIKKYILGELSLVDNPANQNAIINIIKRAEDGNFDYVLKIDCEDIDLKIPESVSRAAQVGLNQRKEFGRGGTSVGLASARRLAAGGTASPEFVRKVARYFPRHAVDLQATGADPGDDGYPSNGRIAWNLWGGNPGRTWAQAKVNQLNSCTTKFDDIEFEKACSCGCNNCEEYDIMNNANQNMNDIKASLQIDDNYDRVNTMYSSENAKLSLMKRFVNWLASDEEIFKSEDIEVIASTESVEAENDILEEEMDIDILKEALGTVIDQRLTDFAASIKEEVDASVTTKIDELAKGFEEKNVELADKLASAEKALAEQNEKVDAFSAAGAMKKSVDPEEDDDADGEDLKKSHKSFWGNVYLPDGLIKSLGYKS
jgi:hypothetical protein